MRPIRSSALLFLSLILTAFTLAAQQPATSGQALTSSPEKAAAPDYSKESEIGESFLNEETYAADGTAEISTTAVIHVLSDAGVRSEGVVRVAYEALEGEGDIVYARVRKPDGKTLETDPKDAQIVDTPASRYAPMYTDLKAKELPIRGLSVGDRLEFKIRRRILHPAAPGNFWTSESFPKGFVILKYQLVLRVPKDKYVNVVSRTVQPTVTTEGAEKVYTWNTSQLEPTRPEEKDQKDKGKDKKKAKKKKADEEPDVEVTTFHSWQDVGDWFASLERDRAVVTPAIQAKADDLTKGLKTDEDRIRALYSFVSTNYRYIGIDLGTGRYQPHSAEAVMENQYGDCKDKHTLLAALLKAAGYTADAALITPNGKLRQDVPSPAQFNHVITAVQQPGGLMWMDATPETAPFRLLLQGLRNQDALLVPPAGEARIVTTPADPPFPMSSTWTTDMTVKATGEIEGTVDITSHNDDEVLYREVYRQIGQSKWDTMSSRVLNFAGDVTQTEVTAPADLSKPFDLKFHYSRKDWLDANSLSYYPVIPNWTFPLNKDSDIPDEPFLVGSSGTTTFIAKVKLPEGFGAQLPASTHLSGKLLDYSNVYSIDKGVLTATRVVALKKEKADPADWDEYLRWEQAQKEDEDRSVPLLRPGETAQPEAENNPEAQRLLQDGAEALKNGDHEAALDDFDRARTINPRQPGLHAAYAGYHMAENDVPAAVAEYKQEFELQPRNARYAMSVANMLVGSKHRAEAMEILEAGRRYSPNDPQLLGFEAQMMMDDGKPAQAESLLEKPANAADAPTNLKLLLAHAYVLDKRDKQASALLTATFDTSKDAMELNDAAYYASLGNIDLAKAQAAGLKSVKLLEESQENTTLENLTQADLTTVRQFSNVWDTLGWIYFQQSNLAQAEPYVHASWALDQAPVVGEHLGEIYEKQGKREKALEMYELSIAAEARGQQSEDTQNTRKHRDALKQKGVKLPAKFDARMELQQQRTYALPNSQPKFASAEFFVIIGAKGVEDTLFISGKDELRDVVAGLKNSKMAEPLPPDSNAKITRRGVISCSTDTKQCTVVLLQPQYARAK